MKTNVELLFLILYQRPIWLCVCTNISDVGRKIVDENDGVEILLRLLRYMLSNTEPESEKLRTIACGFLLNVTNSNGKFDFHIQIVRIFWISSTGSQTV